MHSNDVLTLWIPQLMHPQRIAEAQSELKSLKLEGLQRLVSSADKFAANQVDFYQQASYLYHQPDTLPVALCRALADGLMGQAQKEMVCTKEGFWLCVDPVHMVADRDSLVLIPNHDLAIDEEESKLLVQSFNAHFGADGLQLMYGAENRWYLYMPQPIDLQTTVIDKVAYKPINAFYPQGSAAQYWRQLINETQMLFFNHPVNEKRRLNGQPDINSIWVWGQGQLNAKNLLIRNQAAIYSAHPYLEGMAQLCQSSVLPNVSSFEDWLDHKPNKTTQHLVVLDNVLEAIDDLTLEQWLELLQELEKNWFSPLLKALKNHEIAEVLIDIGANQRFLIKPAHLKRFWRFKKPLNKMT